MKRQQSLQRNEKTKRKKYTKADYAEMIERPSEFHKACSSCKEEKPLDSYPPSSRRRNGRETICRTCINSQQRRTRKYYPILVDKHGEHCSICHTTPEQTGKRLSVDHCHSTGETRGLLCDNCNHGIGKFKERPKLLLKAIWYIIKHKARR